MHTPVLLKLAVKGLALKKEGIYIDATAGEGGHLQVIAKKCARVLAIDIDKKQITNLKEKFRQQANIILRQGNFAAIESIAKKANFYPVDGVLFDFGLSYCQIKEAGLGLSFNQDQEILDMRLDNEQPLSAYVLLNTCSQEELFTIFAKNSEEIYSQQIAREIVKIRSRKKIIYVYQLKQIIDLVLGKKNNYRTYARIFQALRIAVNNEFENIKLGLKGAYRLLKSNGRLVVISFHSLEDRIVKQFAREHNLLLLNKKAVDNNNSDYSFERSAKIRILINNH